MSIPTCIETEFWAKNINSYQKNQGKWFLKNSAQYYSTNPNVPSTIHYILKRYHIVYTVSRDTHTCTHGNTMTRTRKFIPSF